jgi:predicted phosphodiesterase
MEFEGWQVLITHTKESHKNDLASDIKPEELVKNKEINMLLYGHTHLPKIKSKDRIIYVNPGHLRLFDKKYPKPTFGVIEFEPEIAGVKIYDFKKKTVIFSKMFIKPKEEEK